jgi:hypothetical protein
MSILLSISGLFKTVLILIGVFVALRFLGQMMIAKRNIAEQNQLKANQARIRKEKEFVEKNKGKISISRKSNPHAEDVDYEEV